MENVNLDEDTLVNASNVPKVAKSRIEVGASTLPDALEEFKDIRTLTDTETRLFNFKSILAYSENLYRMDSSFLKVNNPLKIFNDEGELLGFASVDLVNDKLMADINIAYASPERLDIEVKQDLFVHAIYEKGTIDHLVINTRIPSDSRILPAGEQLIF